MKRKNKTKQNQPVTEVKKKWMKEKECNMCACLYRRKDKNIASLSTRDK